ncbi:hypothetical protein BC332_28301 [Capsicum chinense]|nr:hypothetical protein BC332_28301 [Capsicum chinense]
MGLVLVIHLAKYIYIDVVMNIDDIMMPSEFEGYINVMMMPDTSRGYIDDIMMLRPSKGYIDFIMMPGTSIGYVDDMMMSGTSEGYIDDIMMPGNFKGYIDVIMMSGTSAGYNDDIIIPMIDDDYKSSKMTVDAKCGEPWIVKSCGMERRGEFFYFML